MIIGVSSAYFVTYGLRPFSTNWADVLQSRFLAGDTCLQGQNRMGKLFLWFWIGSIEVHPGYIQEVDSADL